MNTSYAKLKIQLNFPLDSYAKIESFLECIKDIFPEQVVAYCGNSWKFVVKDGYSLKMYNSGTDLLNTYYRQDQIPLDSIELHNFSQQIALAYFASDPDNNLILWGNDRKILEDIEKKILKALKSMSSAEDTGIHNQISQQDFLEYNYEEFSFSEKVFTSELIKIISARLNEIKVAMKNEIPLAAIFLMGSTLEGILLALAKTYPDMFNQSNVAPKDKENKTKPFSAWSLNNYIEVAFDLKIFDLNVKKFSHELRDFRNYIHPNEQLKNQFSPNIDTAKIGFQVLKAAVSQINTFIHDSAE